MKRVLRSALVGTAVGAIGLSACDATPPEHAVKPPVESSEVIPPAESVVDVVQKSLAEVVRDEDAFSRARRLGTLLPTLGPEMIPAVKHTLADPMVDLTATEVELLLRFWASHQPEEATRWAKDKSPTRYRQAAIFSALSVWAERDPQAAVAATWNWVADLELEGIVPIALVRGWYAKNDPAGLRKFLRGLPPGIPGQRAITAYVRVVIQTQGADAVMRWAESLPNDEDGYKLTVFRRVVAAVAHLDVDAAMAFCNVHCDGPYGKNLRLLIARNWVQHDPQGALAWLSTGLEGYDRNLAIRVTFALWMDLDRKAALSWMAAQTAGEPAAWLRPTYPVYARGLSESAPAEAIKWAALIEDEQERESVTIGVARVWRHLDEAAAEKWLVQSSLSEDARAKVRAPVDEKAIPRPTG
jgi:hypothetical protein